MLAAHKSKNKISMEIAEIKILVRKSAMVEMARFRVVSEFVNVIMLKMLMIFVTMPVELNLKKSLSLRMEKYKFMIH
jgi:hypothetical protein